MQLSQQILAAILSDKSNCSFDDAREMDIDDLLRTYVIDRTTAFELHKALYDEAHDIPCITINLTHAELNRITGYLEEYKKGIIKTLIDDIFKVDGFDTIKDLNIIITKIL